MPPATPDLNGGLSPSSDPGGDRLAVPGGLGRYRRIDRSARHAEDPVGEPPLVEDVKALLVGCGIQASNLYHQIFDAAVLPNPGGKDQHESWAIVCSSADEVATIPFVDSLYRTRVQTNAGRRRRGGKDAAKAGLDDCLGFYTIRSIIPEAVEPVYDLEVAGGHAFIADGLVLQPGHL
jgi:hypothetical protein